MAGLSLISTYSSGSEDEPDNKEQCVGPVTSSNRLPLPESISMWKGVAHHEEVVDDPTQHDERVRSFKHERGNWATLIYLRYEPSSDMYRWIFGASSQVPLESNLISEYHISVTKTLILKFHWIGSFVEEVKKLCERTNQFSLELLNIQAYCNEEKTRTFLGIECVNGDGTLANFTKNLDNLLAEYGLPPFYETASYHVSIWWFLGDQMACLSQITSDLTDKFNKFLAENEKDRYIRVNEIHLKTGNQLYAFKLR